MPSCFYSTLSLSSQVNKPVNCLVNLTKSVAPIDGLASHPGGVVIPQVKSCNRLRDKLNPSVWAASACGCLCGLPACVPSSTLPFTFHGLIKEAECVKPI